MYLIFGLYLSVFANISKYTYLIFTNKKHFLTYCDWLKGQDRMFFTSVVGSIAALRKLAYSEAAGQTLASLNEWEASEAYYHP